MKFILSAHFFFVDDFEYEIQLFGHHTFIQLALLTDPVIEVNRIEKNADLKKRIHSNTQEQIAQKITKGQTRELETITRGERKSLGFFWIFIAGFILLNIQCFYFYNS
jgi:hypothetical protein